MNPYPRMMAIYEKELEPYLSNIDMLFELQEDAYLLAERLRSAISVLEQKTEIESAAAAEGQSEHVKDMQKAFRQAEVLVDSVIESIRDGKYANKKCPAKDASWAAKIEFGKLCVQDW